MIVPASGPATRHSSFETVVLIEEPGGTAVLSVEVMGTTACKNHVYLLPEQLAFCPGVVCCAAVVRWSVCLLRGALSSWSVCSLRVFLGGVAGSFPSSALGALVAGVSQADCEGEECGPKKKERFPGRVWELKTQRGVHMLTGSNPRTGCVFSGFSYSWRGLHYELTVPEQSDIKLAAESHTVLVWHWYFWSYLAEDCTTFLTPKGDLRLRARAQVTL